MEPESFRSIEKEFTILRKKKKKNDICQYAFHFGSSGRTALKVNKLLWLKSRMADDVSQKPMSEHITLLH